MTLTGDEGEGAQAGEGADVDLQEVKGLAEVEDAVQPVAEAALALLEREDDAVAEHQLRVVRIRAIRQPEHKQFQAGRLEEQFLGRQKLHRQINFVAVEPVRCGEHLSVRFICVTQMYPWKREVHSPRINLTWECCI